MKKLTKKKRKPAAMRPTREAVLNPKLAKLWASFTIEQRQKLADLIGRPRASFRHVAEGRRGISAELAVDIEKSAAKMGFEISRTDLNEACSKCEFARACLRASRGG